LTVDSKRQR